MKPKSVLRKEFKNLRSSLSIEEIESLSLEIANQVLSLNIWDKSTYHVFLPIKEKNEINTEYILHILQGKDKNIVVSKSNFSDFSMSHFLLTDQTVLKKNVYGIPEPTEDSIEVHVSKIDVVFVPLLGIDLYGNRLGYGKGFYDRFLENCKPSVIKVGLSFFEPITDIIEHNENDIKMNFLVHPNGITSF